VVDGETLAERGGNWFTRSFTGYPNLEDIIDRLARRRPGGEPR